MYRTAILKTDETADALVGQVDAALADAATKGASPMLYRYSEDPSTSEIAHIWQGAHADQKLRIIEDALMKCTYAVALSEERDDVDAMIDCLIDKIGSYDCDETIDRARVALATDPEAVLRLTVCNSKAHHVPSETWLLDLSHDANDKIRLAAVQTMAILGWPKLRRRLEAMAGDESNANIRNVLDYALSQAGGNAG